MPVFKQLGTEWVNDRSFLFPGCGEKAKRERENTRWILNYRLSSSFLRVYPRDEGLPSRYDYGIVLTAESFHSTED